MIGRSMPKRARMEGMVGKFSPTREPTLRLRPNPTQVYRLDAMAISTRPPEQAAGLVALERELVELREREHEWLSRDRELSDFLENAVVGLHRVGPDGTI